MYGDALYNPMINPYLQAQNPYQQHLKQEVVKVNGENGARAFPIGANSSTLLLDTSGVIIWLVTTDGAGYKTVMPYDITPHQEAPPPDYSTLEQRISRLEGLIHERTTDTSTARTDYAKCEFSTNQELSTDNKKYKEPTSFIATDGSTKESSNSTGY